MCNGNTEFARAVPDEKYPGMWRVRSAEGRLSDMANLTWAKDAAASMALAILNRTTAPHYASGDARNSARDAAQKRKARSPALVPSNTGSDLSDARMSDLQLFA